MFMLCGLLPVSSAEQPATVYAPVLMLSDLHFDPYRDPGKLSALLSAPVEDWAKVLGSAASVTQAADYAALQQSCHSRGVDSSWAVLRSSLEAARAQQPAPAFVTISGDLLTHNFDCRLRTLLPSTTPAELSAFAQKTIEFISLQLRASFPGVPIYLALGNNDSGCANYRQSTGSEFLQGTMRSLLADIRNTSEPLKVAPIIDDQGDYSIALPKPMKHARLLVLQNVFESAEYRNCEGKSVTDSSTAQIAWLRTQLTEARRHHEHVWVMAHIPPGVDAYASFHKYISSPKKLCAVTAPTMMLRSEELTEVIASFADVVRLALFAHTHMDEVKLLQDSAGHKVAAKLVPSISPVNGNAPAFTIGQVQPQTATLVDYTVFVASDLKATSWREEYRFSSAYKLPDFSADSVAQLTSWLEKDKVGNQEMSRTYQGWFFPGDSGEYADGLRKIWPSYACGIGEGGGQAFHNCMCATAKEAATAARQ